MIEVYTCPGCQRAYRLQLDASTEPPRIRCPRCHVDLRKSTGSLLATLAGATYRLIPGADGVAQCVLEHAMGPQALSPTTMLPREAAVPGELASLPPQAPMDQLVSANLEKLLAGVVAETQDPEKLAAPGSQFGKFLVQKELGRGAMGVVLKAVQQDLGRIVALKLLRCSDMSDTAVKRFLREAQTAGKLNHPNIVGVYEVGEDRGVNYIAMEFVEGRTLDDWLQEQPGATRKPGPSQLASRRSHDDGVTPTLQGKPPSPTGTKVSTTGATTTTIVGSLKDERTRKFLELMVQVCDAVQHAHEQSVIHRDLKPQNILIDQRGWPKLADFGLAKEVDRQSYLTASGMVMGTPAFMSPEQARGKISEVDPRSDIYSLGAILYFGLTGRTPHEASSLYELLAKVAKDDVRTTLSWNGKVDRELDTVVMTALAHEKARRYAAAGDLRDDLKRFLAGEPIHAKPPALWIRWMMRARKSRRAQIGLAVSATLLAAGAFQVWNFFQYKEGLDRQRRLLTDQREADKLISEAEAGPLDFRLKKLTEAVEAAPEYARPLVERARVRLLRGELSPARADVDAALAVDRDNGVARYWRGRILDQSGAEAGAVLAEFEAAERASPGNYLAAQAKAWIFLRETRQEDPRKALEAGRRALDAAQKAIDMSAVSEESLMLRGRARLALGDAHRRLCSVDPVHAGEEDRQAQDDYRGARDDFGQAKDLNADSPQPSNHRAVASLRLLDFAKAYADLRAALRIAPRMEDGWLNHAVLCYHTGRFEQALQTLRFLEKSATSPEVRATAAAHRERVERVASTEADRLDVEGPDARLAAAAHLCVLRRFDDAARAFERILEREAGGEGIADLLRRLYGFLASSATAGSPEAAGYARKAEQYRLAAGLTSSQDEGPFLLEVERWAKDPNAPTDLDPGSAESAWASSR